MSIEVVKNIGLSPSASGAASDKVADDRRRAVDSPDADQIRKNLLAPEEILNKIKGLTEGGQHSVRFEMNSELDKLIISVVDKETGETIRQIPPESLVDSSVYLKSLRGSLLDTES